MDTSTKEANAGAPPSPPRAIPALRVVHAVFAFAVAVLAIQALRRSLQPIRHTITIVPDDAFYYLSLARHFAAEGVWTFDGGLSRTSGFHPLHAYVCALVFRLWPGATVVPLIVIHAWIGVVVTACGLWLLLRVVERRLGGAAPLGALLVVTASNFLVQATSVMEWPWVVLFAALTLFAITEGRARLCVLAALGGMLSRSDFGLLTVAAVAAGGLVLRRSGDRALLRASLYAFAGAVCGLVVLTAHNYVFTHELVQSSARIKAFWGKAEGYQLRYGFEIGARAAAPGSMLIEIGHHSIKLVAALHAAAAVVVVALLRRFPPRHDAGARPQAPDGPVFLGVLGALALTFYAAVYASTSAAIQTWYTANFVVPVALLYCVALQRLTFRVTVPAAFAAAAALAIVGLRDADRPHFPAYSYEMDAGRWLRDHPPSGRVGSWNAGLLNYFEGGHVVNIDGLTNNAVVPYILADKLHCYLLENDVRHVMDWSQMVDCRAAYCPDYPALGGYTSGVLARSLTPEYVVPGTAELTDSPLSTSLTLYSVDMAMLAGAGDCGGVKGRAAVATP